MNTQQLTRGAMVCAIYGLLLFLNQQTGLMIESSASWLFVLPILVYTAMYGAKVAGIAALAMCLMTFLFGGFTTWFYSWLSILSGYVYGSGVFRRQKNSVNFLLVFLISFVSTILMVYLWAAVFDLDLMSDFKMIVQYFPSVRWDAFVLAVVVAMALLEALCIHLVGILLCTRLRIAMRPLNGIDSIESPRWVGIVSLVIWLVYFFGQSMVKLSPEWQTAVQAALFLDAMALDFYGVVYFMTLTVRKGSRKRAPLAILGAFIPVLQILWILSGEMDCLLQIRKNYLKQS
ncbi:DUF2232 domain-containing protein [Catenisphaera adipataccumulans]|uniref:Cbb3-type cytochrome oxidase subunit 3 n=1 Tax=Catenisphaera adipataccumulans TaxID=700500 RepID=A0A7W8CVI9_9FIRM|nr:DUF2232 domain-containing protein [Catenisphaera adipataccumulans]MBB5182406.1 cbb3-type cytochrome oxidase subunit 3 [Catenisphaera adipataccumulans]